MKKVREAPEGVRGPVRRRANSARAQKVSQSLSSADEVAGVKLAAATVVAAAAVAAGAAPVVVAGLAAGVGLGRLARGAGLLGADGLGSWADGLVAEALGLLNAFVEGAWPAMAGA